MHSKTTSAKSTEVTQDIKVNSVQIRYRFSAVSCVMHKSGLYSLDTRHCAGARSARNSTGSSPSANEHRFM